MYIVIGLDEDWYTFETFMGVFSTKEKAQKCIDNNYEVDTYTNEKIPLHQEYEIRKVIIDKPAPLCYN